ncbi:DUF1684 domain-containing protein [Nannocystis sp. SCPEA4]|uniref:DUF1684 domain-containing protein n=1 Tax=Nannocystis sp. SCPEA4 TaxID=2996787 RepID=UPI00226EB001|nr:DUF1684 domain-containing protein [Nannocystis sp. SCPEA4]MCY1058129.1 DUF1684 domain-containing protein [Nannocystis sp. SCPEA4]
MPERTCHKSLAAACSMRHVLRDISLALALTAAAACHRHPAPPAAVEPAYAAEHARWHAERIAALRAPQGWLALAGLYWLQDGDYRLGADPAADIVFPEGAPSAVGTLTLADQQVRLRVAAGVDARVRGQPVTDLVLRSDVDPAQPADRVELGDRFTFLIIARGARLGLRLYDGASEERREFAGIATFALDPAWVIRARFEPLATPRTIEHPTVLGTVQPAEVPGVAVFTLAGREHRLTPILEHAPGGDALLFVFSDQTSGHETYHGGRFLLAEPPQGGELVLDFNRAHNPPCAFTAFATCPVPLAENRLPLAIHAGEKTP